MYNTKVYSKNLASNKRLVINRGGTSSSKTISILQLLLTYGLKYKGQLSMSVVSETMPHLKRGAMRDFFNILIAEGLYNERKHNKSDHIYEFAPGRFIEFFSCDNPDKVLGPRRDVLFMNEVINSSFDTFENLEVRTKKKIFLDYNPKNQFWLDTEILDKRNDFELITSTYLDAIEVLPPEIVKSIELRREINPNWWKVYGLGETGEIEGLVFKSFNQVETMPDAPYWYGLDFGFTNDPSALIRCCLSGGELFIDELLYEPGLTNRDISDRMIKLAVPKHRQIYADSSEPKSIEELRRLGWNIHPAKKGSDSLLNGIQLLQNYKINITKTSVNLIKEFRNYEWKKDRMSSKYLNEPIDDFNHGIDALRYATNQNLKVSTTKHHYSTGVNNYLP